MAISLNSLNSTVSSYGTRITNLENKIGSGGGIIESKLANPGYVKFANGLIINFGSRVAGNTFTFAKAFTGLALALGCRSTGGEYEHSVILKNVTTSSCYVDCRGYKNEFKSETIHVIAIGYLITNRVKNGLFNKISSIKELI